jgi:hypothetical protein
MTIQKVEIGPVFTLVVIHSDQSRSSQAIEHRYGKQLSSEGNIVPLI